MKKVWILSTSLRAGSNSEALAGQFAQGAKAAGHEVEMLTLRDRAMQFCRGCLACQKTHRCVIQDDAQELVQRMGQADVLVFASPIYYYEMCGQMKTLLDRANPLFGTDYAFREVYLLATAADEEESAVDGAVKGLEGWIACFPKARLAGVVFGGGVTGPGEIQASPALARAREMGERV